MTITERIRRKARAQHRICVGCTVIDKATKQKGRVLASTWRGWRCSFPNLGECVRKDSEVTFASSGAELG